MLDQGCCSSTSQVSPVVRLKTRSQYVHENATQIHSQPQIPDNRQYQWPCSTPLSGWTRQRLTNKVYICIYMDLISLIPDSAYVTIKVGQSKSLRLNLEF